MRTARWKQKTSARRNMSRAKCRKCKAVIESRSRHDFVVCNCKMKKKHGIFLDGGSAYLRYGGNMNDFEWLEFKGKKVVIGRVKQ